MNYVHEVQNFWSTHGLTVMICISIIIMLLCWIFYSDGESSGEGFFDSLRNVYILENKTSETSHKKIYKYEERCRDIVEQLFNKPFPKVRPHFLKNPKTNRNLELDVYNEQLKLAIERNDTQHYFYTPFFHKNDPINFKNQQWRDNFKRDVCISKGITLIEVPYTVKYKELNNFILYELEKAGFVKDTGIQWMDHWDIDKQLQHFRNIGIPKGSARLSEARETYLQDITKEPVIKRRLPKRIKTPESDYKYNLDNGIHMEILGDLNQIRKEYDPLYNMHDLQYGLETISEEDDQEYNEIKDNQEYNEIKDNQEYNEIKDNQEYNKIKDNQEYNKIKDDQEYNEIKNDIKIKHKRDNIEKKHRSKRVKKVKKNKHYK
jgi:hypothetical protein